MILFVLEPDNVEIDGRRRATWKPELVETDHESQADVGQYERDNPADVQAEQSEESSRPLPPGILRSIYSPRRELHNSAPKKRPRLSILRSIVNCL